MPQTPRLHAVALVLGLAAAATCTAAPATYKIDPAHTFPSFEADHMGISVWRGKMNRSRGTVVYDKATGTGTVDITIDLDSIDFGLDQLNAWARGAQFFQTKKYPRATYTGTFDGAVDGVPQQVLGTLTLHGESRPLVLKVHALKCIPHPLFKRDYCGADASGSFNRDEFGLGVGKEWGFRMDVALRIQVEALADK